MVRQTPAIENFEATKEYTVDPEGDADDDRARFRDDYHAAFDGETRDDDDPHYPGFDEADVMCDYLRTHSDVLVALPEWLVNDRIDRWQKGMVGKIVDRTGSTVTIESPRPHTHVASKMRGAWKDQYDRENGDLAPGESAYLHKQIKNHRQAAVNLHDRDAPRYVDIPISQIEAIFFVHKPLRSDNLLVAADGDTLTASKRGTVRDGDVRVTAPDHTNKNRTYLHVDYEDKDDAKACGASWDKSEKSWYVDDPTNVVNWVRCMAAKGYTVVVDAMAEDLLANDGHGADWSTFDGYDGARTR